MKLVRDIRRQAPDRPILVFGEERWAPYNRVLLTPLFPGETAVSDIYLPRTDAEKSGLNFVAENKGKTTTRKKPSAIQKYFTAVYADTGVAPGLRRLTQRP